MVAGASARLVLALTKDLTLRKRAAPLNQDQAGEGARYYTSLGLRSLMHGQELGQQRAQVLQV